MKKYFSIVFMAIFVLFGMANNVLAETTSILSTTGVGNYHSWQVVGTGLTSGNCSSNYINSNNTDRSSFTINLSSVPNGSTITNVAITSLDRANSSIGGVYKTFVRLNSSNIDASTNLTTTSTIGCTPRTQNIPISSVVKSNTTNMEIGVQYVNTHNVRVGGLSAVITYTPALSDQTINFGTLSGKTYGDSDFSVSATATSSLPVSFASQTTGVCTVSSSTVHIVSTGTCTVRASQAGNASYNPAPNVDQSFIVAKIIPTLSVTNSPVIYNATEQSATITSGSISGVIGDIKYDGSSTEPTNAGTYSITADFIPTDTTNYASLDDAITGSFVINKADANCTISGYSGTYDSDSHGLSGSCLGIGEVVLSGLDLGTTFTEVPGGTATWAFTNPNYNDNGNGVSVVITQRDITITADAKGKNYSESDPSLTYGITTGSLVGTDNFTGTLVRDVGEDVGTYPINQGSVVLNPNYNLTYIGNNFTVGQNTITVTADSKTKEYGVVTDPDLTYQFTPSPKKGDSFSGSLTRTTGENVGSYGISQGTLKLSDNYVLSFTGNNLSITPIAATITADPQTKVYGTTDPVLTYQKTGLINEDSLLGALSRDAGENVGTYAIKQGTLNNDNYTITYTGANLEITKADQTIDFGTLSDKTMGDPDFILSANSSSELPVSFSTLSEGICSISEGTVKILGIGTCTVLANQAGNINYNSAPEVSRSFEIAQLTHTISSSSGENGSISPSGIVKIADGTNKEFTITPADGYKVLDVIVDEHSVGAVVSYNFSDVKTNHFISASFIKIETQSSGSTTSSGGSMPMFNRPLISTTTPPAEGQVLGAEKYNFTLTLKMGSRGNEVKELQKLLNSLGFECGAVDGVFGIKTKLAVVKFQVTNGIKADGIVGPLTRAVLNK